MVLARAKDRVHRPVYYISHVLHGVEERYTRVENFALAVVIIAQRLRLYFQITL